MKIIIAIGIGVCIGLSSVGKIPGVKLFITAVTGG